MPIILKTLTDVTGSFNLDEKEVTLQWIVLSDKMTEFAVSIAQQGTLPSGSNMAGADGEALGWLAPGSQYRLGDDFWSTCYAGPLEVNNRQIIGGKGDFEILPGLVIRRKVNDNPTISWDVKQRYSTTEQKANQGDPSVDDRVTINMSYEWEDLPFTQDLIDLQKPVLNSAGQLFSPPAVRRRKIVVYSISRREIWNPLAKAIAYSNCVNLDVFYGAAAGTILMDTIVCNFDGQAWNVTYNLKEKPEGWAARIMDTGYYQRGLDGKLYPILADDGTPIYEPAKLNGTGQVLPDQAFPGINVGPFHKYPAKIFSLLQVPNPFMINTIRSNDDE
jgi:hypothetical protein